VVASTFYHIPPAWIVVGRLGVFNLLLVGAGMMLWRSGRLDLIGYVIPLAALAVSALLVFIGRSYRQGLTPTAARLEMVQVIPGTDDQRAFGVASLSSPSTLPAEISGSHGGWGEMRLPDGTQGTRRLIWTDHEKWHWENLRQPAGLQLAAYQSSWAAAPRVEASATFSASGLTGKLHAGANLAAEDAMVVSRDGRISALSNDGSFSGGQRRREPRPVLSAGLLSDEQNRRGRWQVLSGRTGV
jgi:uncharacterized SAM-binding protein YcdF (DUF218 family)